MAALRNRLVLWGSLFGYAALASTITVVYSSAWGRPLSTLGFGIGPLVTNMLETGLYEDVWHDILFTRHRSPLTPLSVWLFAGWTPANVALGLIARNLFVIPLLALPFGWVAESFRGPKFIAYGALGGALCMPQLMLHQSVLASEEALVIPLLAIAAGALFAPASTPERRTHVSGFAVANALLVWAKSTLLLPALVNVLLALALGRRELASKGAVGLLVAVLSLTAWNGATGGTPTIWSSWSGWNLAKGNNPRALELYPKYTLDVLELEGYLDPPSSVRTEADYDRHFRNEAFRFVREHPEDALRLVGRRFFAFFVEIRPYGLYRDEQRFDHPTKYVGTAASLAFRLALWSALAIALVALRRRGEPRALGLAYLGLVIAYASPNLLAFAYERHTMPLVLPTVFFLLQAGRLRPERSQA